MKIFKLLIFYTCIFTTLSCCSSIDYPYLDDNLSDRIEVANTFFSEKPIYFDTSKYGRTAILNNGETTEIDISELPKNSPEALVKLILFSAENKRDLAISGRDSKHTVKVLKKAFSKLEIKNNQHINILFIGDTKHFKRVKGLINKNITLFFKKIPPTSP